MDARGKEDWMWHMDDPQRRAALRATFVAVLMPLRHAESTSQELRNA